MAESTTVDVPSRILLLAGGIAPPPVAESSGVGMWSVALTDDRAVLDAWVERLHELGEGIDGRIRMLLSRAPTPNERTFIRCRGVEPVVDTEDFRGPAGAVRDASADLDDEAVVLIAELSRCPLCPIESVLRSHVSRGNAVTVASNPDGSPAGVYAVTAGALSGVPARGYTDIKEQWLPAIRSERQRVGVQMLDAPGNPQIRTSRQLAEAGRALDRRCEVVVRRVAAPGSGALRGGDQPDRSAYRRGSESAPVRTRSFPDGSIKACQKVVDGTSTGSRALSDERVESSNRPTRDG